MQTDGTLLVPDVPTVPYITGDGVGAEVTPAMQAVVWTQLSGKHTVANVVSNGKKCWRENVPSTRLVPGCRMKQWKPFRNTW